MFAQQYRRLRPAATALLLVALVSTGCPKPKPPPTDDTTPAVREDRVRIDRLSPSSTTEGKAVTVTVSGKGFEDGMEVFLGGVSAPGVDVLDDRELTFRATADLGVGSYDVRLVLPTGEQGLLRDGFRVTQPESFAGDCSLKTVFFEFDEASLTNSARAIIAENARCTEARGYGRVRIEGHADERGSTEYNLSLGQRRADSVRKYMETLVREGISLATISYGEERPADSGRGESAWAANRRVELVGS